jgi:hypothetical protein
MDFDDFDEEDFELTPEDREESRKEHERIENLPVMKKAKEIFKLVTAFVETFPEEAEEMDAFSQIMMEDAMMLAPKIAGAEGGDLYILRMENAVIIKMAARNLMVNISGLNMFGYKEKEYSKMLRNELEEFQKLFVEWVKGFEGKELMPDGWGLFYSRKDIENWNKENPGSPVEE